jgi:hypothetical protein
MQSIGHGGDFSHTVHGIAGPGLTAISFTPTAAFQQTPGPAAGQRLAD